MELHLDPVVPMLIRGKDGRPRFNRGHTNPNRGKTFDEIFGKERSKEIRLKISQYKKSNHGDMRIHCKPCLAIHDGKIIARFPSTVDAGKQMGLNKSTIQKYIKGKTKPSNGWRWFYEAESWKWAELIIK